MISLAMIVKNEEAALAHCLESARPLVDEMVIVDTGSTDGTIEIAKGFGAKIHHFQWRDDFSAARNESLKYCTGDWVLILDADEAIDPLDYQKIKDACQNPYADGYAPTHRSYLPTSNLAGIDCAPVPNRPGYSEGKGLPFYMDTEALRLARAIEGLRFEGRVHETFRESMLSQGRSIAKLDAVIHHYGKLFGDREEHKAKYCFMLASQEAEKNPSDKRALFNLLQQALAAQEWGAAHRAAKESLSLGAGADPFVFYGGGLALQQLGRHEEAIAFFDMLLAQDPKHALAALRKGSSCKALGNINGGRQLMAEAIALAPDNVQAHGCLAELELEASNIDAARSAAQEGLKIAPNEAGLYELLLNIDIACNDYQGAARHALMGIQNCPGGGNGAWHRLAFVYLMRGGETGAAKSIMELGLKAFPDDPELKRLKESYG